MARGCKDIGQLCVCVGVCDSAHWVNQTRLSLGFTSLCHPEVPQESLPVSLIQEKAKGLGVVGGSCGAFGATSFLGRQDRWKSISCVACSHRNVSGS